MKSLFREFLITSPAVWQALGQFIKANAGACIDADKPLRVIVTTEEKKRSLEQNSRLWKAVYEQIAEQAWVNGQQFSKDVWHEHFASMLMPKVEVITPYGEIVSRRKSTTELTVGEFAEYMTQVEAWAVNHLGVMFDA